MEEAWGETPLTRFWVKLHNQCVDNLVNDPEQFLLKHMRHDHDMVRDYQKRFGRIFEERGLNLYELIARACGEIWDDEDEEKGGVMREKVAPMEVKSPVRHALSLDCPREIGVRQRKVQGDDVQAGNGFREKFLQEGGQGCRVRGQGPGRSGSPQKAPET